jgi:hypothetical protein
MMPEIDIQRYDASREGDWNDFVARARNGTFILDRSYMDYHADRFPDCSWIFSSKSKIVAVLPGTLHEGIFSSHNGLTYGGLVLSNNTGMSTVCECFELLNRELNILNASKCVYKCIPYFYHKYPTQEDLYALFRLGATLVGRSISSTIYMENRIPFIESRKAGLRKAARQGIQVRESDDLGAFWAILKGNLAKNYKVKPVHSVEEISLLKNRFPERIRLFGAFDDARMVGGTVIFDMRPVVHVQYISASEEGKNCGALDALFAQLVNDTYKESTFFDFGTSTENMGLILNENLLFQKEGFGGRGAVYDVYEYSL